MDLEVHTTRVSIVWGCIKEAANSSQLMLRCCRGCCYLLAIIISSTSWRFTFKFYPYLQSIDCKSKLCTSHTYFSIATKLCVRLLIVVSKTECCKHFTLVSVSLILFRNLFNSYAFCLTSYFLEVFVGIFL